MQAFSQWLSIAATKVEIFKVHTLILSHILTLIVLLSSFHTALAGHARPPSTEEIEEIVSINKKIMPLYKQGKYVEAIELSKKIVNFTEKYNGPDDPGLGTFLLNMAIMYKKLGNNKKATELFQRCIDNRRKNLGIEHDKTISTMRELILLYIKIGEYAKAVPLLTQILAIKEKRVGLKHSETAAILNLLATVYSYMGEYAKAASLFNQSLAICEQTLGPQHPDTATILNNLARLYQFMGENAKAQLCIMRALTIRNKTLGPKHPDTATSLNNLAALYKSMGEYAKAEPLFKRSLAIREKSLGPEHPDTAISLNNLAALYDSMGEYAKAEPLFKCSLAISEKTHGPEHPETARSLNNLAGLYESMGAYAKAEPLYKRSLAIWEKKLGSEHPSFGKLLHNLAALYVSMGDYDQAVPLVKRGLAITEKKLGPEHPETGRSLGNLAVCYASMGDFTKALPLCTRAVDIIARSGEQDNESHFRSILGRIYLAIGEWNKAIYELQASALLFETIRSKLGNEQNRLSFQDVKGDIYEYLATAHVIRGQYPQAFETLERGRNKAFMDLLATHASGRGKGASKSAELLRLEDQAAKLRSQKGALIAQGPSGSKTRAAKLDSQLSDLDKQRLQLIEEIRVLDPELGSLITVAPPKLEEIQALLPYDVMLVEYFHPDKVIVDHKKMDLLWIFTVTKRNGVTFKSVDVTKDGFSKALANYAVLLADQNADMTKLDATSAELYNWLITPITENLAHCKTVVFVPWGPMYKIPLGALTPKDGKPLITDKAVVVAPSAGVYTFIAQKRHSGRNKLFVLGNPKTSLAPLPGAEREATDIAALFDKATVELRDKATEGSVKRNAVQLGKPDVIHFACHGIFNQAAPQLSHLALTPDQHNDGRLEMHELYALDWSGVSLVTMSACSSGKGKLGAGDDLIGLTRGFMYAGAPSVLSSLWDVDDAATRELMRRFYKNYLGGMSKPEALRQAQMAMLGGKFAHPNYWASFEIFGDWM